ncbi:hypothetical protein EVAR_23000_1 [Eumeta japonica]|uniref:Uncharacterized protein n=1 Tax=Eumeta variegata TaxID=151549 RepID=A0A4C1UQ31_EUMVA|nr:hypothetical protein EVAR_23000_1 [Eumeta japonica]
MISAAHGKSQSQRNHQCVANLLGRNRISNVGRIGLMEMGQRQIGHRNSYSLKDSTLISLPGRRWRRTPTSRHIAPPPSFLAAGPGPLSQRAVHYALNDVIAGRHTGITS